MTAKAGLNGEDADKDDVEIDWSIEACSNAHIHIDLFNVAGKSETVQLVLDPEDAYDLMQDIGRAYDAANITIDARRR